MPDEQKAEEQESQQETAPAPEYVTKDALAAQTAEILARIQGVVEGFTARSAPSAEPTPQRPTISLDEINESLREGDGTAAGKIDALVNARVQEQLDKALKEHVSPIRDYGLPNLAQVARQSALSGLKHSKRFEREINDSMAKVDPRFQGSVEAWKEAYALVVGRHSEELERETEEATMRKANDRVPDKAPTGSNDYSDEDGKALPKPEEVFGTQWASALKEKGVTLDEQAKRMGLRDAREYLKLAKTIDEYDGDLI